MFAELIDAECTPDLSDMCILHVRPLGESIPVFDDVEDFIDDGPCPAFLDPGKFSECYKIVEIETVAFVVQAHFGAWMSRCHAD